MPYDLHLHFIDRVIRSNADSLDITSKHLVKQQECGDMEQDTLECLEAYGVRRGHKLCKDFLDDYTECMLQFMQKERNYLMKRERLKQVMRGERKPMEVFDSIKPPRDSYQTGPFYN
ncbi:NADH:ubiquinone oxidoreductase-like protein [Euroglyphus maynei]|uniref:NADH:ubiquinone oxidoreductase-like protein n=1 Tax=Euroglyphus maynei TaxID=6958 RepID=A0A1Y3AQX7_EURMA|nr:NADH:ubiquinone oxidoreductase-like protein [Euroglyphus maynei]